MLLAAPTGRSIHSFQFLLKYPKIRSNEPSTFCSHPSYTDAMFKPVVGFWARGPAAAAASAVNRKTIVRRRAIDRFTAAGRPRQAAWVGAEWWRTSRAGTPARSVHQKA